MLKRRKPKTARGRNADQRLGKSSTTETGRSHERELAARFRQVMPGAEKQIYIGEQQNGGDAEADVEVPLFWIEAKDRLRPNAEEAVEQAREDADPRRLPIAIIHDRKKNLDYVRMDLETFYRLIGGFWQVLTLSRSPKSASRFRFPKFDPADAPSVEDLKT